MKSNKMEAGVHEKIRTETQNQRKYSKKRFSDLEHKLENST